MSKPTTSTTEQSSETDLKAELAEKLRQYFEGYEFKPSMLKALTETRFQPLSADSDKETLMKLNPEVYTKVEAMVDAGKVVIISGAYRTGKSSLMTRLLEDRKTEDSPVKYDMSNIAIYPPEKLKAVLKKCLENKTPMIVEEFSDCLEPGSEENLNLFLDYAGAGGCLVADVALGALPGAVEVMKKRGIQFEGRIMEHPKDENMMGYITDTLQIDASDKLAQTVFQLSGGSVAVAKELMYSLQSKLVSVPWIKKLVSNSLPTNEVIVQSVEEAGKSMSRVFGSWETQRNTVAPYLGKYVPDPPLKFFADKFY